MINIIETGMVNAIGEPGVKLDLVEKSMVIMHKNTSELNYTFDKLFYGNALI